MTLDIFDSLSWKINIRVNIFFKKKEQKMKLEERNKIKKKETKVTKKEREKNIARGLDGNI